MKRIVIILALWLPFAAAAQNTMYFMDRMPQTISYNPALFPKMNFYIGLPGISEVSAQGFNNGFNFNDLDYFLKNLNNPGYNPDEFVNAIGDYNNFTASASTNLLSVGFRLKDKGFLSFLMDINGTMNLKSASDIAYLIADFEDIDQNDFPIVIDDISLNANSYMTFGFSYAHQVTKNFTVGITPRIIFNQFGIKTKDLSYKISLVQSGMDVDFEQSFSGEVELGLPARLNPNASNNGVFEVGEPLLDDNWTQDYTVGRALSDKNLLLDLGMAYQLSNWNFSASILNLGGSVYKTDGVVLSGSNDKVLIREVENVRMEIPARVYMGAMNQFSPDWYWGVVFNSVFGNTGSNTSATASINGSVAGGLSASLSYTAGYKFNNVGLGLRFRFLPGTDFYLVTDNLIQVFAPRNAYRFSAAAGINIAIGVKQKVNSEEILPEE